MKLKTIDYFIITALSISFLAIGYVIAINSINIKF